MMAATFGHLREDGEDGTPGDLGPPCYLRPVRRASWEEDAIPRLALAGRPALHRVAYDFPGAPQCIGRKPDLRGGLLHLGRVLRPVHEVVAQPLHAPSPAAPIIG